MRPPGSRGGSRRAILKRADASLKRLRVDAVDLYFVHGWDNETDVSETLGALDDLRRAGKIHHIGWSNVTGWQLERICRTAEANGLPMPCALQPQVSLLERGIELEILPCALANNIGLTPWSPLGGGWLTGKYTANERPTSATRLGEDPNRGVEAYDNRNTERTDSVPQVAAELAAWHERPMSHIAMAWLADRPGVASLLLGARNVEQMADNLDAASLALKDHDLNALTEASNTILPDYPYGFVRDWSEVAHWDRLGRS